MIFNWGRNSPASELRIHKYLKRQREKKGQDTDNDSEKSKEG